MKNIKISSGLVGGRLVEFFQHTLPCHSLLRTIVLWNQRAALAATRQAQLHLASLAEFFSSVVRAFYLRALNGWKLLEVMSGRVLLIFFEQLLVVEFVSDMFLGLSLCFDLLLDFAGGLQVEVTAFDVFLYRLALSVRVAQIASC